MRALVLALLLGTCACGSAPRIEGIEWTRTTLQAGEETFATLSVADDEADLDQATAQVRVTFALDEELVLEESVSLGSFPEGTTQARSILGLSFTGVPVGTNTVELRVVDSGGAESEPSESTLTILSNGASF